MRKSLGIEFEGYTWPERFVVLTTPFDFEAERGYCYRNYFSDPDEWANLFKVAGDDGRGQWRVVFPTRNEESDDEALSDDGRAAPAPAFFSRSRRRTRSCTATCTRRTSASPPRSAKGGCCWRATPLTSTTRSAGWA